MDFALGVSFALFVDYENNGETKYKHKLPLEQQNPNNNNNNKTNKMNTA